MSKGSTRSEYAANKNVDAAFDALQEVLAALPETADIKLDSLAFKQAHNPFNCEGYVHNTVPSVKFKVGDKTKVVTFNVIDSKYAIDDVLEPVNTDEFNQEWSPQHVKFGMKLKSMVRDIKRTVKDVAKSNEIGPINSEDVMAQKINKLETTTPTLAPPTTVESIVDEGTAERYYGTGVESFTNAIEQKTGMSVWMVLMIVILVFVLVICAVAGIAYKIRKDAVVEAVRAIKLARLS